MSEMRAMVFHGVGRPLTAERLPIPAPGPGQVLVRVSACGVCRTDLHVIDGDLLQAKLPLILGHQIVGTVAGTGPDTATIRTGDRIGIPWLGHTCGCCDWCKTDRENLCDDPRFTGYQIDGGFAEYAVADAHFCFPIPDDFSDLKAAPLLCAGLIGYRSLALAGPGKRLGLFGFGSAAHIVMQVAKHEGREVYAFTRPGDDAAKALAEELGAAWAGGSDERAPADLDAAIIYAPVGSLVPVALRHVVKGGTVVCSGIHMSDIPSFPYADLWGERVIRSVANLTRADGEAFLEIAPRVPVETHVTPFALEHANEALDALRTGSIAGAAVLDIGR